MNSYTTLEVAERVEGELLGPADLEIIGVAQLAGAQPGQISFVRNQKHVKHWPSSQATAVLVSVGVEIDLKPKTAVIRVENADLAMVKVLELFSPPVPRPSVGVHPAASVDPSAWLGDAVAIGPHAFVGRGVSIGSGSVVHANVTIMDDVVLGPGCVVYPGVVIRERCELGARVIVHANAVIGSDGFGYTPSGDGSGLTKIPHVGSVRIGDDVEIGSGTCVDRGKFAATTIGSGTKIDNLCQIAHNCQIGRDCILVGQTGLSGSVTLEDGVVMGGQGATADNITIGAGAKLIARPGAFNDVPAGVTWGGFPARDMRAMLREIAAVRRLPDLIKELRETRAAESDSIDQADDPPATPSS